MFDTLVAQLPRFFTLETGYFLLLAAMRTVMMAAIGCGIGFFLAFVLVFLRTMPGPLWLPLRSAMIAYVEFFRRVPFLVLLFLVLFATKGFGFSLSLFTVACVSVVILSVAFTSEIIRAGIESVHQAQWDAAGTMNFTRLQTLRYVIIPQAWKVILPPAFAFFITFIKETSLASQVGVVELTQLSKYFNATIGYSAILSFGSILVFYFLICYPLTRFGWWMEARLDRARRTQAVAAEQRLLDLGRMGG